MIMLPVKTAELAEARAKLYQLLAAVYARPPGADFLRFLAGGVVLAVREADDVFLPLSTQIRHSLDSLDSFFKQRRGNSEKELGQAVSVSFTMLFRGVKPHYSPLPPYESVYREQAKRVFGELTVEVLREYRRFGLGLTSGLENEPPDHISFELEFMHLLCRREAEAGEKDNRDEALRFRLAEQAFLREHLMTWLPGFCIEVRKYDRLGLFSSLADLTEGWVNFDFQQHLNND